MPKFVDLTGKQFGRFLVLALHGKRNNQHVYACVCVCGTFRVVNGSGMTQGQSQSCGCLNREIMKEKNVKHGKARSHGGDKVAAEYTIWGNMLQRCNNSKHDMYEYYGGRGIKVCDEWKDFSKFLEAMGDCPPGYSIDRIDVNGNYCKENCRWVSKGLQNFNIRLKENNKTGRSGVQKTRHGFTAYIGVAGKNIYLGSFNSFEDACRVRTEAELKHYGFSKE